MKIRRYHQLDGVNIEKNNGWASITSKISSFLLTVRVYILIIYSSTSLLLLDFRYSSFLSGNGNLT